MQMNPPIGEGNAFSVKANDPSSNTPLHKHQHDFLRILYLGFIITLLFTLSGNAQQMHSESNAVSIDNESDGVTGWYSPGTALITSESISPYHGNYVLKVEASSTLDNDRNVRYQFNANVGEVYDVSIWVRTGAQSVDPAFASWDGVSGFSNPTYISTSGTWTEYNFTVTATATTITLRAYTGSGSNGAIGDVLYLDHVSIVQQDNQNPTAPTNLVVDSSGNSTIDLSWSAATDNMAVTGYKIYKNGILEENLTNVLSYQVTGLAASTNYSFTVTAIDASGNESAHSNTVSGTTTATSSGSSVWSENGNVASYIGNVGIGTNSVPTGYSLAVEGHIRTREIRVDQDSWPDYVFQKEYPLPSLAEVRQHIETRGHLPDIPSAEAVRSNGVELGEMDRLLLQKIEEMTLYIIGQQEQIDQLRSEIDSMK